ncbi:MAG: hypothetical protein Q9159_003761 [Coniocarpon cinnabarinum]
MSRVSTKRGNCKGLWFTVRDDTGRQLETYGDVFLLVSPGRTVAFVADCEATCQITARRNDFPKPIEIYAILALFGKNLVATDGAVWRQHRKIAASSFSEKNNRLVWEETLRQVGSMVESWLLQGSMPYGATNAVWAVAEDTMRLSLHVISKAGFGLEMLWPFEQERRLGPGGQHQHPPGHDMSYTDAMGVFLHNILIILLVPAWLQRILPIPRVQKARKAFLEWDRYLREILEEKKKALAQGTGQDGGMDLMGTLLRGANTQADNGAQNDADSKTKGASSTTANMDPESVFGDDEILGNAFSFLFAGHETVANTAHFSLLLLAMNPDLQRQAQDELDGILKDKRADEWDYDQDLTRISNGLIGAILNEELRLFAPVEYIPKSTPRSQPQSLTLANGERVTIPANSMVGLVTHALHRHPAYWPRADAQDSNDLLRFRPKRWLHPKGAVVTGAAEQPSGEADMDVQDATSTLFHPRKGTYIPFSDGPRSCIGRRFAQVEALAILTRLLKQYTVELDLAVVDQSLGNDAQAYRTNLQRRNSENRRQLWTQARDRACYHLDHSMVTIATMQMRNGKVPIRVVERGMEVMAVGETSTVHTTEW